jgi:hypothetical protein
MADLTNATDTSATLTSRAISRLYLAHMPLRRRRSMKESTVDSIWCRG